MGAADQRAAAGELLRQRASRCHGRRYAGGLRRVLWHHRRPGLRLNQCRRQLGSHCEGSAFGAVGRGSDTGVSTVSIRVHLPAHLRTLAGMTSSPSGEIALEVEEPVTQRSILDTLEMRYPML